MECPVCPVYEPTELAEVGELDEEHEEGNESSVLGIRLAQASIGATTVPLSTGFALVSAANRFSY